MFSWFPFMVQWAAGIVEWGGLCFRANLTQISSETLSKGLLLR